MLGDIMPYVDLVIDSPAIAALAILSADLPAASFAFFNFVYKT